MGLHDWLEDMKKAEGDNPSFMIGEPEKMVASFTEITSMLGGPDTHELIVREIVWDFPN